jgi:hypothetical protein
MQKKWYLSKTVWVGFVTLVYGILLAIGVVGSELSEATLASILGIIVVFLRLITKEPVIWKSK